MFKHIDINHPQAVKYAVNILEEGGVIIYPTDTLYGFGADATNDEAINKINQIKGRSGPMSVMAADEKMAINWMDINNEQIEVVKPYLGGAQTLIAPVKPNIVSSKILGEDNTLGIRIPNNKFCNELSFLFGKPIISTSVNRVGGKPMNDPVQIEYEFSSEVNLLIDAGTLLESKGSKIYKFEDNKIIVLRE
ncbi:threonylcarbamoyl-AMP synthase [bacterium]|nr:threonylcarbamoyl-AMP synthase [bacterium]